MTWQPGDLALCVRDDWASSLTGKPPHHAYPRSGGIYTVSAVDDCDDCGDLWLAFEVFGPYSWNAANFRRIAPLTDEGRREAVEDLRVPEVVS